MDGLTTNYHGWIDGWIDAFMKDKVKLFLSLWEKYLNIFNILKFDLLFYWSVFMDNKFSICQAMAGVQKIDFI